jgi:hypothetical protein
VAAKRKTVGKGKAKKRSTARESDSIGVRRVPGKMGEKTVFELVHPPCVGRRAEDLEEVYQMLDAGETEVAVDELRWLLSGCHPLLEAHRLLGQIAMADNDLALARAHLDYAYQLGWQAARRRALDGVLPQRRAANREFFRAGFQLVECLNLLEETSTAAQVLKRLAALDPAARPDDPKHTAPGRV